MKYLIVILFLMITSCKSETKTEKNTKNGIDQTVNEMWDDFIASNPEFKDEAIPEAEFFHNNKEDANRLAELTLNGKKKASSGLLSLYKHYNVDLPKVGTKQIITDFDGRAKAIIVNRSYDTIPFHEISKEYAEMDMGTDIEPLKKWKKAHWDFFEAFLEELEMQPSEEMLVVCTKFETIWPEKE